MKHFETTVVGLNYRVTPSTRRLMQKHVQEHGGMPVLLVREHDNTHDKNAVKVVVRKGPYKGLHIGYLTRGVASSYAPALDEQTIFIKRSEVTEIQPDEGTATLELDFKKSRKGA